MSDMPWRSLRAASKLVVKRRLDLQVEGLEHIPASGPAIIAARHYHHLYDGAVIVSVVPRPVHILVALDWVQNGAARVGMDKACRTAGWPVVLRRDGKHYVDAGVAVHALRHAIKETMLLFDDGRIVLVFPEAFPNIDPGYTPKTDVEGFLPFRPGLVRFATLAAGRGLRVPIVPAGFAYQRGRKWRVTLRVGAPVWVDRREDESAALELIEGRVRDLSG
jgi:1-acyl-sn-glycerol-3-phosphate acyltransferase